MERSEQVQATMKAFKRLALASQGASTPAWLELDLSMAQIKGLFTLARHPGMPVGRFAEILGIGEPAASLLVDRLVRVGLAARTEDPADRRRTLISLSHQGEELVSRLRHGGRDTLEGWLERLSDEQLTALESGLRSLVEVAERSR
ncbi:MAG: MarR family winged helix-turn-helix transcriptional regulator [Mycobacterium leprae]